MEKSSSRKVRFLWFIYAVSVYDPDIATIKAENIFKTQKTRI
jgi:hypothetical protein